MKRGGPLKRKTPLRAKKGLDPGKKQLKRTPLRAKVASRERPTKAWLAAKKSRCEVCGGRADHLHHVVKAQHVRKRGGDQWDPRNSLSVCFECHEGHHDGGSRRIPVARLSPANLRFALELLGEAAVDYLARHYAGARAEVEERLSRAWNV